jgi:hypothetical protein
MRLLKWLIWTLVLGVALSLGAVLGLGFLFIAAEIEGREGMP